ncbi:hypothetical protein CROQUDRAFT_88796 [Cronartium quercuum f. sp. fusiforme G11]|uniref:Uncharacterized protein n=1 Tax=Cronartium quercuum f. sp. fusiforme G11 TaxID=708437 RepID=A0A9P6TFG3_9BASI|nr:hypothetical protein CROQUDRAFT_88796 [Cronartium quercuum f. sp. fusiforme G11]
MLAMKEAHDLIGRDDKHVIPTQSSSIEPSTLSRSVNGISEMKSYTKPPRGVTLMVWALVQRIIFRGGTRPNLLNDAQKLHSMYNSIGLSDTMYSGLYPQTFAQEKRPMYVVAKRSSFQTDHGSLHTRDRVASMIESLTLVKVMGVNRLRVSRLSRLVQSNFQGRLPVCLNHAPRRPSSSMEVFGKDRNGMMYPPSSGMYPEPVRVQLTQTRTRSVGDRD